MRVSGPSQGVSGSQGAGNIIPADAKASTKEVKEEVENMLIKSPLEDEKNNKRDQEQDQVQEKESEEEESLDDVDPLDTSNQESKKLESNAKQVLSPQELSVQKQLEEQVDLEADNKKED